MNIDQYVVDTFRSVKSSITTAQVECWKGTKTAMWGIFVVLVIHSMWGDWDAPITLTTPEYLLAFGIYGTLVSGFWYIMLRWVLSIPLGYIRMWNQDRLRNKPAPKDLFED